METDKDGNLVVRDDVLEGEHDRYKRYEKIYLENKDKPLPWFAKGIDSVKDGRYLGYFVPRSDPRIMFIGSSRYTGSFSTCQKVGASAESSAIHSMSSDFGALFVVEDLSAREKGWQKFSAYSWVWSNGRVVVFDSIESAGSKYIEIFEKVAEEMKELGAETVLVGGRIGCLSEAEYGSSSVAYPEDVSSIYTDARSRRKLANILSRMIRLSNKVDIFASDISDRVDRLC